MKDTFKIIITWIIVWSVFDYLIPGDMSNFTLGVYIGVIVGYFVYGLSVYLEKKKKNGI
jgi:uncharacterized membrane-anchored protein